MQTFDASFAIYAENHLFELMDYKVIYYHIQRSHRSRVITIHVGSNLKMPSCYGTIRNGIWEWKPLFAHIQTVAKSLLHRLNLLRIFVRTLDLR